MTRIVYMGAGEIGLPALRWLIDESGGEIAGVFTQPDKPVGRKRTLTPPEVKVLAEARGIPVFQPESFRKNPEALEALRALRPDLIVVMAYGQILPRSVIEAPAIACVNLHASLLPRHRGAAPIQAAILAGDPESGITLMHIVPRLDAGDMILKKAIPLAPDETGGSLHDRLAALGPAVLAEGLPPLVSGAAPREPQDEALATYAGKLERDDGEIDWSRPAEEIARRIRAYDPWPGTHTWLETGGETRKLKLFPPCRAETGPDPTGSGPGPNPVGSVRRGSGEAGGLRVACGGGTCLVFPAESGWQLEGRKRLALSEFLRGQALPDGTKLGRAAQ